MLLVIITAWQCGVGASWTFPRRTGAHNYSAHRNDRKIAFRADHDGGGGSDDDDDDGGGRRISASPARTHGRGKYNAITAAAEGACKTAVFRSDSGRYTPVSVEFLSHDDILLA